MEEINTFKVAVSDSLELQEPDHVTKEPKNEKSYTLWKIKKKKKKRPPLTFVDRIVQPVYRATFVVGDTNQKFNGYKGYFGGLVWLLSVCIHFAYDIYQSFKGFGHVWLTVAAMNFLTICVGTMFLGRKVTPWLEKALIQLEKEGKSKKTLEKVKAATKRLPWVCLVLAVVGSAVQYSFYAVDETLDDMIFNQTDSSIPKEIPVLMKVLRFTSLFHVYFAYSLFWGVPLCIMIMTGHCFMEFQDSMFSKLKDKEEVIPFKEAVLSFSDKVSFLEHSYKSCSAVLGVLLLSSVGSFALNAYNFMYHLRKLTFIWLAIMPMLYAIYPLCVGAWITKQYRGYVVTVVKAWANRPESEDEDEDEKNKEEEPPPQRPGLAQKSNSLLAARFGFKRSQSEGNSSTEKKEPQENGIEDLKRANGLSHSLSLRKEPSVSSSVSSFSSVGKDRMKHLQNVLKGGTRAIGKMQTIRNRTKFNFDKYIAYLQNVVPGIGFRVAGVSITWNRITTILFLEFSILALFLQETIFGNQESTL